MSNLTWQPQVLFQPIFLLIFFNYKEINSTHSQIEPTQQTEIILKVKTTRDDHQMAVTSLLLSISFYLDNPKINSL